MLFLLVISIHAIVNLLRIINFLPLQVKSVLQFLGVPWLLDQLNSRNDDQISAAQYCIQTVINSLTGMNLKEGKQPDKELCDGNVIAQNFVHQFGK